MGDTNKEKFSDHSSPQDSSNDYGNDENSSNITFKNTKTSYKNLPKTLGQSNKALYTVVENVTIK